MSVASKLVKPAEQGLIRLEVLGSTRLSPHWMRVTLGAAEAERFQPMGYDQWFRLFLPVGTGEGMDRIPAKANSLFGYLKYLRIPEGVRPVMRNYTVRSYRRVGGSGGPELDVDFVLHGSAAEGTAGPASAWAETCQRGDSVVIIDEGLGFNPARGVDRVLLVSDETGLPAIAGIAASLASGATGTAVVEVPDEADALSFDSPGGLDVRFVVRSADAAPGRTALDALTALPEVDAAGLHAFVVGEQTLVQSARRHLVGERRIPKDQVSFVGYWKLGKTDAEH